MKKYFLILILILFILTPVLAVAAASDITENLVWLTEPWFEYDNIWFCYHCAVNGLLGSRADMLSDMKTILDNYYNQEDNSVLLCIGHCGGTAEYFYDGEKEVFVLYDGLELEYYTVGEFIKYWDNWSWDSPLLTLTPVRRTDSEKIKLDETGFPDPEYIGDKYALIYGDKFITDFIYDDYKTKTSWLIVNDLIDVKLNGKWGIIDKTGNIAIPFIFEDIEFIDEKTAFAKYDGKYGVLDVRNTIANIKNLEIFENIESSPKTGDSNLIYIMILVISVILTRGIKNKCLYSG